MQKTLLTALTLLTATLSFGQNAEELNKKSIAFIDKQDFKKAVPLIRQAAEMGSPEAQYHYGLCFQKGIEVQQNDSIAFIWFLKSANQGWPKGQLVVATFYMEGKIGKPNFSKALEWIKRCATVGEPECMWSLSGFYEYGIDGKQNIDSMIFWQIAVAKLDVLKINEDDKSKIAQARVNLAEWYQNGYKGTTKDNIKSYAWYLLYNEDKRYILRPEENQKAQEKNILAIKNLDNILTENDKREAIKLAENILQHKLTNLDKLYSVE